MNLPSRMTRSLRLSSWVNDINPVNWKIVIVAYMQMALAYGFSLGYFADLILQVIRGKDVNYHPEALWAICTFLAALSGISLGGRTIDRVTDYGYVERKNAGKATAAPQQVNAGDNAQINVANPPQVVPAIPPGAPPADASTTAQSVSLADDGGPGLG